MAYVGSPFVHDVFVSYSHGDDGSGQSYLQPWSLAFARELERELRSDRRFRQDLRLFLDDSHRPGQGIDPMAPLTDQLRDEIGASAILVVLMSPDYLASQWCADERDWWCERQSALGLAADERIAVVRIWPTGGEPWPASLVDARGHPLVGFPFSEPVGGSDSHRPLGWLELPGPFSIAFRKAMIAIVGRLYLRLDAFRATLESRQRADAERARLGRDGGQTIYLHGRADHAKAWEAAGMALIESGYAVVPGEPDAVEHDPKKLQGVRERRVEALCGCDALLLLGTDDGRALDADLVVVGKHDRQSARARSNRLLPCGLLDTAGGGVATPVRKATARIMQTDWIDGTQPPWTTEVQRWLTEKAERAEAAS